MGLLEDLEELSLMVPDAPSQAERVRKKGLEFAQAAGGLLLDAAAHQAEATELLDRLERELGYLQAAARQTRSVVEECIAATAAEVTKVLDELGSERRGLVAAQEDTETRGDAAAAALNAAGQEVATARREAAGAAARQAALFEEERLALESAVDDVEEAIPFMDTAVREATEAAAHAASLITRHVASLPPLAKGHLTDADEGVQAHVSALCDEMTATMEAFGTGVSALSAELGDRCASAEGELALAAGELDAALRPTTQQLEAGTTKLAQARESLDGARTKFGQGRHTAMALVEAAYRAEERLTGAS